MKISELQEVQLVVLLLLNADAFPLLFLVSIFQTPKEW